MRHARPHLEIHSRSKGHSAVAGAAYRLGLKLRDERTGIWHDYTRRAAGEEIVAAMTVAPEGAPGWASDPAQLWNAVENSEKRKDAQAARDYRIPVPLGLDDERATRPAEKVARFIMGEPNTPVSVGLHQDAAVDALGQVKPPEMQGYHAHLYFPSRPLLVSSPEDGQGGDLATAAFGPRHPMLISRKLGAGMVGLFDRTWAELATEAAANAGIDAHYDHRSYVRMGLAIEPQPTMGPEATTLERKGFFTRKGDAVREIVVVSKVYELAHAEVVAAQHDQARQDVSRERLAGVEAERPAPATPPDDVPGKFDQVVPEPSQSRASRSGPTPARNRVCRPMRLWWIASWLRTQRRQRTTRGGALGCAWSAHCNALSRSCASSAGVWLSMRVAQSAPRRRSWRRTTSWTKPGDGARWRQSARPDGPPIIPSACLRRSGRRGGSRRPGGNCRAK